MLKWLSWVFREHGCVDVENVAGHVKKGVAGDASGGVTKMLSCLVLLLSHGVAMPAARKTPPTGTQGPRCGVGLALFLSPRALSERKSKTRGEGAATNHQNRSRATLKK